MSAYRSTVAKQVRHAKQQHPERYCAQKDCLWRVQTARGVVPCPKHPKVSA